MQVSPKLPPRRPNSNSNTLGTPSTEPKAIFPISLRLPTCVVLIAPRGSHQRYEKFCRQQSGGYKRACISHRCGEGYQQNHTRRNGRVRKISANTAKQHLYHNDRHKTADHRHPERKRRRQVKRQQHAGDNCAAVGNRIGLLGHNVIQIFKNDTGGHANANKHQRTQANSKVAAIAVRISATTTVNIMLEVVTGSFRCGEVTTKVYFSM